jgi:hypothetical protein
MSREGYPYPYHLSDSEIVKDIMKYVKIGQNPNKWRQRVYFFFKEHKSHPIEDLRTATERTREDSNLSKKANSIYSRTRDEAYEKVSFELDRITIKERKNILEASRYLAKEASASNRNSITQTQVNNYIKTNFSFMITKDVKIILWVRSNLVLGGFRE